MIRYLIALLSAALLFSCASNSTFNEEKIDSILDTLKDHQAKINLVIDGKPFYSDSSVFMGGGFVDTKGIKISLKDQSMGNVIINLEGANWFNRKPYRIDFKEGFSTTSTMGSFLAGKISSTLENKGEGYILYDGFLEVKYVSEGVFVVNIKGNLKKPFGDAPLSSVEGFVIWKKPDYTLEAGKGIEIEFPI